MKTGDQSCMVKGHDDDYNKPNISREQLWHVHSGKSIHCEIFEMIIRDRRFSSLIDHDKNHILLTISLARIIKFCYYRVHFASRCERLQYIVPTEIM
jgi:hypothetical protein